MEPAGGLPAAEIVTGLPGGAISLQNRKQPSMGTAQRGPGRHAVAFCQEVVNREVKIGKGRLKSDNALFLTLLLSGAAVTGT